MHYSKLLFLKLFFINTLVIGVAEAVSIKPIACNWPLLSTSIYTVLDYERNKLSGWNHIQAKQYREVYTALSLNFDD